MQPETSRKKKSPLARYAPFIVVVVIVVVVAAVIAVVGGGDDDDPDVTTGGQPQGPAVPVNYAVAAKAGETDKYTWQTNCDLETGLVAIPTLNNPPCVPKYDGNPGTPPVIRGVTADTIRIGYYSAKPDPQIDTLTRGSGTYDPPELIQQAYQTYSEIYENMYELYGRKVELVKVQGTGVQSDEIAARNDAEKAAKEQNLFAVMGGPGQARSFAETLAANKVLCVGTCLIAAPQRFYQEHSPYLWPTTPSPEQTSQMLIEFITKQLKDKNAEYAGNTEFRNQKRTFALLSYDTPDGQYASSWDNMRQQLTDAGINVVLHKNYFLDLTKIPQTAREIAVALKEANATTVIFTGDPFMPQFFTAQASDQNYFPEWLMAGTVLADTSAFARTFDQEQWKHAFGLQLTPARVTEDQNIAYNFHEWWHGKPPPTENSYGITWGNVALLYAGLQAAGRELTPETFKAGLYSIPPPENPNGMIDTITTYGNHGLWEGEDPNALDNAGILWWDPEAEGEDETGEVGKGMYRLVDGGKRYIRGQWPTEPIKLFDPAGTVTIYDERPEGFKPKDYPPPPGSPAAG